MSNDFKLRFDTTLNKFFNILQVYTVVPVVKT